MQQNNLVAIVTLCSLIVYFWMAVRVARARASSGIHAPAMTGDPTLERHIRVQANTLEWLPIFLVSLWLFAHYWNAGAAAALGAVWIAARIAYALLYVKEPKLRGVGFLPQTLVCVILLFGALFRAVEAFSRTGA